MARRPAHAEHVWRWARRHCLPHFGPYEDAMSRESSTLFHTLISPLLNNLRLLPARVVADVARMKLPIASQEGFVRQVLGWRELLRHVHEQTDGFRRLPDGREPPCARRTGDAGYGHHITRLMVLANLATLLGV